MVVCKKVRFLNHFHELHFIYIIAHGMDLTFVCPSLFLSSPINVDDSLNCALLWYPKNPQWMTQRMSTNPLTCAKISRKRGKDLVHVFTGI